MKTISDQWSTSICIILLILSTTIGVLFIPSRTATAQTVDIPDRNLREAFRAAFRTLVLGHQPAGMYHSRTRAAYWDGQNTFGEKVASGIYFYQLETDTVSTMRKMVI